MKNKSENLMFFNKIRVELLKKVDKENQQEISKIILALGFLLKQDSKNLIASIEENNIGKYFFKTTLLEENEINLINEKQLNDLFKKYIDYFYDVEINEDFFHLFSENMLLGVDNDFTQLQRNQGSYYTDTTLTSTMVQNTLKEILKDKTLSEILNLRILDPAVGSGVFIIETLKSLKSNIDSFITSDEINHDDFYMKFVQNCLFGLDLNEAALHATIYRIYFELSNKDLKVKDLKANFKVGDTLLGLPYYISQNFKGDDKNTLTNRYKSYLSEITTTKEKVPLESIYLNFDDNEKNFNKNISQAFLWENLFPQVFKKDLGFDLIIGNPPWNKIKAHLKEFFEVIDPSIKNMQGAALKKYVSEKYLVVEEYKNDWKNFEKSVKNYSKILSELPFYKNQKINIENKTLGGDSDLYKYFIEVAFNLLNKNGVLNFIIPASFFQAEGTTGLRKMLYENGEFIYLSTIENRDKIFPIDSRFKYAVFGYKKNVENKGKIRASLMLSSVNQFKDNLKASTFIDIPLDLLKKMSPETLSIPDIKSDIELKILRKIYLNNPLINSPEGIQVTFNRELDMTNDSNLFVHRDEVSTESQEYLPLYEGRMVNNFNFTAKEYLEGEGRKAIWKSINTQDIKPHFYVNKNDLVKKGSVFRKSRAAYCDIAGQTNERAVQSTLIPANTISGNKVPTVNFLDNKASTELYWVGITNSFIVDWLMRLRITTTINFFHWNQIPLPKIDLNSKDIQIIIINTAKLLGIEEFFEDIYINLINEIPNSSKENLKYEKNLKVREELRLEIDVAAARLFKLELDELTFILMQFPLLDRTQFIISGDFNINQDRASFVTRDKILYSFNKYKEICLDEIFRNLPYDISNYHKLTKISCRLEEYSKYNCMAYQIKES